MGALTSEQRLLRRLCHELYQTEMSASVHPLREARRLGNNPPSAAMAACAHHAQAVLKQLPRCTEHDRIMGRSYIGQIVGLAFSLVRRMGIDWALGPERSYRASLLGLRHGIDLVRELEPLARQMHDDALADWCTQWLKVRVPLVETVERHLSWFIKHPDEALSSPA